MTCIRQPDIAGAEKNVRIGPDLPTRGTGCRVPAPGARIEYIVRNVSPLELTPLPVQEHVGPPRSTGRIALDALHEICGGRRRVELGTRGTVVAERAHEKEIAVAVTDVHRRQGSAVLERIGEIRHAVHPLREIRRIDETMPREEVDQELDRLVD